MLGVQMSLATGWLGSAAGISETELARPDDTTAKNLS